MLLSLDGAAYEMASGVIVEFAVRRTPATPQRPHAITYALVLRPKAGGAPWVRFDNAHAVEQRGKGRKRVVYDHWHRTGPTERGHRWRAQGATVQELNPTWLPHRGGENRAA